MWQSVSLFCLCVCVWGGGGGEGGQVLSSLSYLVTKLEAYFTCVTFDLSAEVTCPVWLTRRSVRAQELCKSRGGCA